MLDLNHLVYQLWGKSSRSDNSVYHPLIYHLLDTSAVALEIWEQCLAESFKADLASIFEISVEEMGCLLAFWVGLHDIGKAGPEFQGKNADRKQILTELGLSFPAHPYKVEGFHATATARMIRDLITEFEPSMPRKFRNGLSTALGGHHGEFPSSKETVSESLFFFHVGDFAWQELQKTLFTLLREVLSPQLPASYPIDQDQLNPVLMQITGLTTTADWISSNEDFFGFESPTINPDQYFLLARRKAVHALQTLGWLGWKSESKPLSFQTLFPDFVANNLQEAVIGISEQTVSPFIVIIEAQTGSGKTEAALYLADKLLQRDRLSGLYIAMPTQATSNQMYGRVKEFLSSRYPENQINLHLVHGNALLSEESKLFMPSNIYAKEDESNIQSHTWFLPRKKTLLAPFGVGTVDQVFNSVLRSRFFFLRMFGLSHKVLVFDEVHAYDVYMNEVFKRLLHWLRVMGTPVIILTATLPENARQDLVSAYTGNTIETQTVSFPRLTYADETQARVISAGIPEERDIRLLWIDRNVSAIVELIRDKIENGGCAAVICNTVSRAMQVFTEISAAFSGEDVIVLLFHSRFPLRWRQDIEKQVLELFGKDRSQRPARAVLVATQVVEQSLDLDFDYLVTDLAPIDLLIQRIGRLHRHDQCGKRPPHLEAPECAVSSYSSIDEILSQPPYQAIYDPYILAKTWLSLQGKQTLTLPGETDGLIHDVYETTTDESASLEKARKSRQKAADESREYASNFLIPNAELDFISSLPTFFGDDPDSLSRSVITAPTREIDLSVQIVCLEEREDGLHALDFPDVIDLGKKLSKSQSIQCLLSSVAVSNRGFVIKMIENPPGIPKAFKGNASLRWLYPLKFKEGRCEWNGYELTLNRRTGLSIQKYDETSK